MPRKYATSYEKNTTLTTYISSAALADCDQKRDVENGAQVLCPFGLVSCGHEGWMKTLIRL